MEEMRRPLLLLVFCFARLATAQPVGAQEEGTAPKNELPNGNYMLVIALDEGSILTYPGSLTWDGNGNSFTFSGRDDDESLILQFRNRESPDSPRRGFMGIKATLVDHRRLGTCVFTGLVRAASPGPGKRLPIEPLSNCSLLSIRFNSLLQDAIDAAAVPGRWLLKKTE